MRLEDFESNDAIIAYLETQMTKICPLNECRLSKDEQLQLSDEIIHFRNCIEWIIRSNQVIVNIKYALEKCLGFGKFVQTPFEVSENKRLYSYYLEDAVYRTLVLWDMFKQLLNEYYSCGYAETENVTIFKLLKSKQTYIGTDRTNRIINYLNKDSHKKIRNELRNSFTHAVEPTSQFVFHRELSGKIKPQINLSFLDHPFENIAAICKDIHELKAFMDDVINEMYEYRNNKLILLEVSCIMPCGKILTDPDPWNLGILKENYERIINPCDTHCANAKLNNELYVCRPTSISYRRMIEGSSNINGDLTPMLNFEEMLTKYEDGGAI